MLGPGCVRELLFHVLQARTGQPSANTFAGTVAHRIYQAAHRIETHLSEPLDIAALAAGGRMSRTMCFEQFKRVTSLGPVQFQKRLRLLGAQWLLVEERSTAEGRCLQVGYRSPPHFSREYARLFGEPPLENAVRLRRGPVLALDARRLSCSASDLGCSGTGLRQKTQFDVDLAHRPHHLAPPGAGW